MARMEGGEEVIMMETLVTVLREVGGASQAPPGDRYRLWPAIFGGDSDAEQFIREFKDVATIAKWPVLVLLLQLQSCLTGPAKSYTLGPELKPHLPGSLDLVWHDHPGRSR